MPTMDTWRIRIVFLLLFSLALTHFSVAATVTASTSNQAAWSLAKTNPAELMRLVSKNELTNVYPRRQAMRYRLRKTTAKSDTTKQIVETADGGVARLIAMGTHPLSNDEEQQETERLRRVARDPAIEAHRRRSELRDAASIENITKQLPAAFIYRLDETVSTAEASLIRLTFSPNPAYSPPDLESRILTGIRGDIWIDPGALRVVRIDGRIYRPVDFGWGILGSLHPGATILIEQSQTPECGWQMAHLKLRLVGKALLVKTLRIDVEEWASNYKKVPASWSYQDGIRWLLQLSSQG